MTNLEKLENDIREKLPRLNIKLNFKPPVYPNILLSDVLEWAQTKGIYLAISPVRLLLWDNDINEYYQSIYRVNIDKPKLKDQSKELIDYLASLI